MRRGFLRWAMGAAAVCTLWLAAPAAGAAPVPAEGSEDPCAGHCWDVLPPGTNGTANVAELAQFVAFGNRPAHSGDQLELYDALVYGYPDLSEASMDRYYTRAGFGIDPGDIDRRYSPHPDATVVRDKAYGIPHVYSNSRAGAMFSLGYVTAEDRMFLMDALRNVGRGKLSTFAGGAKGNRDFDAMQWSTAPYTEGDLQRQFDQYSDPRYATLYTRLYGGTVSDARRMISRLRQDTTNYVAGVNSRIAQMRANPTLIPGEYAAIGRPQGPENWNVRDIIATASLVGGIFGKGGGGEVSNAQIFQAMVERFGRRRGPRIYRALRSAEDPEAPTTVARGGRSFRYRVRPRRARGNAMPDPGTVRTHRIVVAGTGPAAADVRRGSAPRPTSPGRLGQSGVLRGALAPGRFPSAASNALLVSAAESESGHPVAVMGPQTGYFAPQLLIQQEVRAPGLVARGSAFAGTNLYVQLGRGLDYSWSATSAGQDIIDTFAVELCEPGGGEPDLESMGYRYNGQCREIERLRRTNSWEPTVADGTDAGSATLEAQRTELGLVTHRGRVRGKPVAFTALRPTYFHEVDSATGFSKFNDPSAITGPRQWQRAAHEIGYTFNWFYADAQNIAYFNSGYNARRADGPDPDFPVHGRPSLFWRGWDPDLRFASLEPFSRHPQAVNQRFLTSWNNKQAPGYRASDAQWSWGSTNRVDLLNRRVRRGIAGGKKMSLVELVQAMEDAGTADLRGQEVLRFALEVIRRGGGTTDPQLRQAIDTLEAWRRGGAHRRDANRDGTYDEAEAVALMDAWWPRWVRAQFEPALGSELYQRVIGKIGLHDAPGPIGSAFQDSVYGHARKDLRQVLGLRVRGRYPVRFCGRGSLRRCRQALLRSLSAAVEAAKDRGALYDHASCDQGDVQWCHDAVEHSPTGGITQRLMHWINRPTFQQAVEHQGRR